MGFDNILFKAGFFTDPKNPVDTDEKLVEYLKGVRQQLAGLYSREGQVTICNFGENKHGVIQPFLIYDGQGRYQLSETFNEDINNLNGKSIDEQLSYHQKYIHDLTGLYFTSDLESIGDAREVYQLISDSARGDELNLYTRITKVENSWGLFKSSVNKHPF